MRRLATLALALTMVAAACGGTTPGGTTTPTGGADMSALAPAKDVAPAATMTWWHAMSGVNGESLNKIVAGFNSSQSKIKVETVFQGNYDDLLAKLNTAIASNAAPALVQVYDIGQRYMYDSQQVVPMQAFIDRDKFATSDFEPAVINYYKYQDKLQSMPFNASTPILYFNKDAFKEVGLDPNKPPVTFTEIADAAKKLTKKDASGTTTRYGFGPSIYGWLFEQLLATSGSLYADKGNGRDEFARRRSSTTTPRARRSSTGGRPASTAATSSTPASTTTAPQTPSTPRRPRCTSRAPRVSAVTSRPSRVSSSSAPACTRARAAGPTPAATSSAALRSTS